MEKLDITYVAAAAGGLLSFFSPCVLPLVLPFLAWCGAVNVSADSQGLAPRRAWAQTAAFALGFVTMFVGFGASAGVIGRLIASHHALASAVAGTMLVVFGFHMSGVLTFRGLDRALRLPYAPRVAGLTSAYLVGLSFAFGWSPCIGPILAAILTLAATRESLAYGTGLLAVYGAAMAAPFFVVAAFAERFRRVVSVSAPLLPLVRWCSAVLVIGTGLGVMTGTFWWLGFWLLRMFPFFSRFT